MIKQWIILASIIIVALVFRFYNISSSVPPGLYPDEAINGTDAINALETGEYKVFYPDNNGREGLLVNLNALSIALFGKNISSLRFAPAFFGTLTIIGLFFLTRFLFSWQIAALSSFLMAISFWHTLFSRINFAGILAPFAFVWAMYFFWRGLRHANFSSFAISGIFFGLGFYTYIAFRVMLVVPLFTLLAYWYSVKKDFDTQRYLEIRNTIVRGIILTGLIAFITTLPIVWYFYNNIEDLLARTNQVSVFQANNPLIIIAKNFISMLGMLVFSGDNNWRHNIAGQAMLLWPVGILFVVGLIRSIIKVFRIKRQHGHFSTIHVMLIAWFSVALLPAALTNEGIPHALRSILVIPVIYIYAGEGLWWLYEFIKKWYYHKDPHIVRLHITEGTIVAAVALIIFLSTLTIAEFHKYFFVWAKNKNTAAAFNQNYVDIGNMINSLPIKQKKYVIVRAQGVLVNNIPMPAQTIMYITDSATLKKQKAKNIYYLSELQQRRTQIGPLDKIFYLD